MTCLLLGEGASDLGVNSDYEEPRFQKGPMTLVIDFLATKMGVREIEYELLSRGDVSKGIKASKRKISSRPKEVDPENRMIYMSAYYIGGRAIERQKDAAIYFHDPDRTNSGPCDKAIGMERAMHTGFDSSGFGKGIPMIPIPRSEAWLLAYFQKGLAKQMAYNKSERFEKLPANDDSPKSAKRLLKQAVGARTESETYTMVMKEICDIDWTRVDMPSFNRFRSRLESVIDAYKVTGG